MARQSKKRSKQRSEKLRIRKIAAKKAKKAGKTSASTTSKPRLKANRQKKALAEFLPISGGAGGLVTSIYNVATKLQNKDGYDWLSIARKYLAMEGVVAGKQWREDYFSVAAGYDDKTTEQFVTDVPVGEKILREWRIFLEEQNEI